MTGAPFRIGERVVVVQAIDREIHDVTAFLGLVGTVMGLDYLGGCGQSMPDDPMVGVLFDGGSVEEFWREEIASV